MEQCTGLADAPFPGSGTDQLCALDHPFRLLQPAGEVLRMAGGDTLILAAGSYKLGYGAPGAELCDPVGTYDCLMPPLPSGPDPDHPTRLLGAGWEAGCPAPPELWGSGRPWFLVNLTGSSNVEIGCLEITDHSDCVEDHTGGLACERDKPPYGDWAAFGLYAVDSRNIFLHDLNIHGLAAGGIHAGRLSDWRVENVRIAGNGLVGWEGDLWGEDSANSGRLVFRHLTVEWNGCGETYPGGQPTGCWGQEAGGYGDGLGTADTGGDWIFEDSAFLHNTSDGLDLLYHSKGGTVSLNRVRSEGNAGNQIKITGGVAITNSVLVGNCAFFEGQPFTYWVDHCRALGSTLVVDFTGGEGVSLLNTTLYGQGDGLIGAGPRAGFQCNGAESLSARNSLFLGDRDYTDPEDISFLFYQEGCGGLKLDSDDNLIYRAKNITCGVEEDFVLSGRQDLCQDPLLLGPFSGPAYGLQLQPGSPAIDSGEPALCPPVDFLNNPRPLDGDRDGNPVCDRGAYEY